MLLMTWVANVCTPMAALALTSGPAQPESQSFQSAGVSEMVDLSTGDFKYNIPVLDIDGYPINLNYQSGTGVDDEASWVGLGWNLNIGAINRQVRGLADDFCGEDKIKTEHFVKPKITIGGRARVKFEIGGRLKYTESESVGLYSDSYTGIGAEIGWNVGLAFSRSNEGEFTAGMGYGVSSNTSTGVDISPYVCMQIREKVEDQMVTKANASVNFGYNSRSGIKDLSLNATYNISANIGKYKLPKTFSTSASLITYNTEPVLPTIQVPFHTTYESFSVDAGPTAPVVFVGAGVSGYRSKREVKGDGKLVTKAYGFMYADQVKGQSDAIMDFIREKDNPVVPNLPNLAIPIHTPDLFSYTSQTGSGQFKLFRSTGAFCDNQVDNTSKTHTLGTEVGWGGPTAHGGLSYYRQTASTKSSRWDSGNDYLSIGDFQGYSPSSPQKEHVYFKIIGEKTGNLDNINKIVRDNSVLAIKLDEKNATSKFVSEKADEIQGENIENQFRTPKRTVVSYLTAKEATIAGLDKEIKSYKLNDLSTFPAIPSSAPTVASTIARNGDYRKGHHLSELTVTDDEGMRMVYGIPTYNRFQEEISFAAGNASSDQITYDLLPKNNSSIPDVEKKVDHKKGIDEYYHKETQPAYATSFLLTGILSPDYVDMKNDGITFSDDAGTAIKFNYTLATNDFNWRTPFGDKKATVNKGLAADLDDDKASIIHGKKELWYVHSIESKTKIAYFILDNRLDALGVKDWNGALNTTTQQKRLMEIRLYSKENMSVPIKVVKFGYGYSLCPGVPNKIAGDESTETGKLTLNKVWFEYGGTKTGENYPYIFSYNNSTIKSYDTQVTDRWGVYKGKGGNLGNSGLTNEEFPYSLQDSIKASENAALWNISTIELPSGGKISVTYESDDYAYVQNKRAAIMRKFTGLIKDNGNSTSELKDAAGIQLEMERNIPPDISAGDLTAWFRDSCLAGSEFLYTKLFVNLLTSNYKRHSIPEDEFYDYIPTYCKVSKVVKTSDKQLKIYFQKVAGCNPIIISAWQRLKNEYPKYAFPGFENRAKDGGDIGRAVKAIGNAIGGLAELKESFYSKAKRKGYASAINIDKSFIRLVEEDGKKLGGGCRVKEIKISDEWQNMVDETDTSIPTVSYGQSYKYTLDDSGSSLSSGVASYEPAIGTDENILKQPVNYTQRDRGALTNFFHLEKPFGESFFPAPTIIYSRVKVIDLVPDKDNKSNLIPDIANKRGFVINEFFTAKDYPVSVKVLPIQSHIENPSTLSSLLGASLVSETCLSQGYGIELNDMPGKPKAEKIFNKAAAEISSVEYFYCDTTIDDVSRRLINNVPVIKQNGQVVDKVLGRDIDFFTDIRQQEYSNTGLSLHGGFDWVAPWFFMPHLPRFDNDEYKLFRSVCAVRLEQNYGILKKIVKRQNGASITTENIAYDDLTGEPLASRTQNEFNNYVYNVSLPAYWMHSGMAGAYQNLGMRLTKIYTTTDGAIQNFKDLVYAGDEIIDIRENKRYWVIEPDGVDRLIDIDGRPVDHKILYDAKLIRSGHRNQLNESMSSFSCLNNPIKGTGVNRFLELVLDAEHADKKILSAFTNVFDDKWAPYQLEWKQEQEKIDDNTYYVWGKLFEMDPFEEKQYTNRLHTAWYLRTWAALILKLYKGDNPVSPPEFTDAKLLTWDNNTPAWNLKFNTYWDRPNTNHEFPITVNNTSVLNFQTQEPYMGSRIVTPSSLVKIEFQSISHDWEENHKTYIYDEMKEAYSLSDYAYIGTVNVPVYGQFQVPFNPYVHGYLGNWRVSESKVYQDKRSYKEGITGRQVKDAGFLNSFRPYWAYSNGRWDNCQQSNWITGNTVTLYDKYGQELENVDALQRYSAAKFDFNGTLPAAVASNCRNRELYNTGFEDHLSRRSLNYSLLTEFMTANNSSLYWSVSSLTSHTGNFCLRLDRTIPLSLSTTAHEQPSKGAGFFSIGRKGIYYINNTPNLYLKGFEPRVNQDYIFSAWVKDDSGLINKTVPIAVTINYNNTNTPMAMTCKAVVEGWKLVEGTFKSGTGNMKINLSSKNNFTFLDDIRIHPIDAQVKTYSYSDRTFKLMAELDENNFATFYEYDDEGGLVRVKKETERGIVTLKESRSSKRFK